MQVFLPPDPHVVMYFFSNLQHYLLFVLSPSSCSLSVITLHLSLLMLSQGFGGRDTSHPATVVDDGSTVVRVQLMGLPHRFVSYLPSPSHLVMVIHSSIICRPIRRRASEHLPVLLPKQPEARQTRAAYRCVWYWSSVTLTAEMMLSVCAFSSNRVPANKACHLFIVMIYRDLEGHGRHTASTSAGNPANIVDDEGLLPPSSSFLLPPPSSFLLPPPSSLLPPPSSLLPPSSFDKEKFSPPDPSPM